MRARDHAKSLPNFREMRKMVIQNSFLVFPVFLDDLDALATAYVSAEGRPTTLSAACRLDQRDVVINISII